MNELVIASRYASALFEIAHPAGQDEAIEAELVSFSAALKASPELEQFFNNPYYSLEDKTKALRGLYKGKAGSEQETLVKFFGVILRKNRFYLVHDIAVLYKKIADEFQQQATLVIRSAVTLSEPAEREIVSRMEKIAGAKVEVTKEVDPSILGGVIVRFRNKVLDGSVKSKIQSLKKELIKNGSV